MQYSQEHGQVSKKEKQNYIKAKGWARSIQTDDWKCLASRWYTFVYINNERIELSNVNEWKKGIRLNVHEGITFVRFGGWVAFTCFAQGR